MKTLHLLRHAKSSWADVGVDDHDRDLNKRGERDAPRMGEALAGRIDAQPVCASSALRAQRTLAGLCRAWPALAAQDHKTDSRLYTFAWQDLLAWLQHVPAEPASLLLIGHNPALTDLCNQLVGYAALDNLPTAGYLRLTLELDAWSEITEGVGRLEDHLFPRDLP